MITIKRDQTIHNSITSYSVYLDQRFIGSINYSHMLYKYITVPLDYTKPKVSFPTCDLAARYLTELVQECA